MARIKKTTFIEDVFALVAMLPWWAGLMLAVLGYGVLHYYATIDITPAVGIGHLSDTIISTASKWHSLLNPYSPWRYWQAHWRHSWVVENGQGWLPRQQATKTMLLLVE
ncbi:MAG TPA: hypothetical protein PK031_02005 [Pseudomonadales bacterium]|nr:hypothetical protein [Pseudomonadales bacterium]